jgi:hypothetical protein
MLRRLAAALPILFLLAPAASPAGAAPPVDYAALGVPAVDREWSPKDYDRAEKSLAELATKDPAALPKVGQGDGVFARMVADDNFNVLRNEKLPVSRRLGAAVEYAGAVNRVAGLYGPFPYKDGSYTAEAARVIGHNLDLMALMIPLADRFLASLSVNERQSPARLEGYNTMISGLAQSISGVLTCVEERAVWQDAERLVFLDHLLALLPVVSAKLSAETRRDLPARVQALLDGEKSPEVRTRLLALRQKLPAPPSASQPSR